MTAVGNRSSSGAAAGPGEDAFCRVMSPTASSGQGTSHDSEHHFLQELIIFVFQGMSGPAL